MDSSSHMSGRPSSDRTEFGNRFGSGHSSVWEERIAGRRRDRGMPAAVFRMWKGDGGLSGAVARPMATADCAMEGRSEGVWEGGRRPGRGVEFDCRLLLGLATATATRLSRCGTAPLPFASPSDFVNSGDPDFGWSADCKPPACERSLRIGAACKSHQIIGAVLFTGVR
jgi:hypothetical protein